jgi:DNA-binding response OmpR family regulator
MKILLIEDDIQLNTTIKKYLELKEFEVISLTDGEVAINTIEKNHFDLYIIDINLPNINGLDILKYIRQINSDIPIIIITASLELSNFQNAFSYGCNEYIKKPFYLEELEIRINNILDNKKYTKYIEIAKDIIFDFTTEDLIIDNTIIRLRKKEKKLLSILLRNFNKTVPTEEIERYVWENEIKESYPLRQLINNIKHYFNEEKFIYAEKGLGYKFEIK